MSTQQTAGWRFTAQDMDGKGLAGTIHAETESEALEALRSQGLIPLSVDRVQERRARLFGRRSDPRALSIFTRQFATLIDSAIPILAAIEMLAQLTHDGVLRSALKQVARDVNGGSSLSEALMTHPRVFPPLYVHMVEAGEVGGTLPQALEVVAEYMESSQKLKDRVMGALIYPIVVLGAAGLAVAAILAFVVPVFSELFTAEGLVLPFGTRVLMSASSVMVQYWPFVFGGVALLVLIIQQVLTVPAFRRRLDVVLNEIPFIGTLTRKAAVARLTRALASMVHSGVILSEALLVSARVSGNSPIESAVLRARKAIQGGSSLSAPLSRAPVIPELMAQMVKVGEESGRLEEMLDKVADFYEAEVEAAIDGAMKALEPALIVVLGVVLGGIIVTMYTPIFDLMTSLG